MNCQRSYLSRVLAEGLHLTPEHAFNLSEFLEFSNAEREYFVALLESERAATPSYQKHWQRRIAKLKEEHDSIQERTSRKAVAFDGEPANYFTSWTWTAIHFLTALPEYQSVTAIADRLHLSFDMVLRHLKSLEARGMIERRGEKWRFLSGEFHAPADSPLVLLHHQNWRGRALLDAQDLEKRNLHFTGVLTLSRKDVVRIKELLLDFITEANRISGPSKPEECIALTCDLFPI